LSFFYFEFLPARILKPIPNMAEEANVAIPDLTKSNKAVTIPEQQQASQEPAPVSVAGPSKDPRDKLMQEDSVLAGSEGLHSQYERAKGNADTYLAETRPEKIHDECITVVEELSKLPKDFNRFSDGQLETVLDLLRNLYAIDTAATDITKSQLYVPDPGSRPAGVKVVVAMENLQAKDDEATTQMEQVIAVLEDPGRKTRPFQALLAKLRKVVGDVKKAGEHKNNLKTERRTVQLKNAQNKNLKKELEDLNNVESKAEIARLNGESERLKQELRETKYPNLETGFKLLDPKINDFEAQITHLHDHINNQLLAILDRWKEYRPGPNITENVFFEMRRKFEALTGEVQGAISKVMNLPR
jgi:hypothetical protein